MALSTNTPAVEAQVWPPSKEKFPQICPTVGGLEFVGAIQLCISTNVLGLTGSMTTEGPNTGLAALKVSSCDLSTTVAVGNTDIMARGSKASNCK
jgi:hypothetical protein